MPDQLLIIQENSGSGDVNSHTLESCQIRTVSCLPTITDDLMTECAREFNCNICGSDKYYYLPWIPGDKIQIQTLFPDFVSTDAENPNSGWGQMVDIELLAANDTVIASGAAALSDRYYNSWNGVGNYQVIELDTIKAAFAGLVCWKIRITAYDATMTPLKSICSHSFKRLSSACPAPTIRLEGKYSGFDCDGFYYGEPEIGFGTELFAFSNALRVEADLIDGEDTFTKTTFSGRVTATELTRVYTLSLLAAVPPGIKNYIVRRQLAAPVVLVDNYQYDLDNFQLQNQLSGKTRMWVFSADLSETCDNDFGCLPLTTATGSPPIVVEPPAANACCTDCIIP